jgi:chorismate mutase
MGDPELRRLRRRIERWIGALSVLLNDRMELAREAGRAKADAGAARDPRRRSASARSYSA